MQQSVVRRLAPVFLSFAIPSLAYPAKETRENKGKYNSDNKVAVVVDRRRRRMKCVRRRASGECPEENAGRKDV
jgi:hypothetical protein